MVYINMLPVAKPHWPGNLTTRDLGALTPLIWGHVNPYGGSAAHRLIPNGPW